MSGRELRKVERVNYEEVSSDSTADSVDRFEILHEVHVKVQGRKTKDTKKKVDIFSDPITSASIIQATSQSSKKDTSSSSSSPDLSDTSKTEANLQCPDGDNPSLIMVKYSFAISSKSIF